MMGFYNHYILPVCLDLMCGIKPIARQRQKIVPQAYGQVLEIGMGSGHNLPFYDTRKVSGVVAVEPDERVWQRSAARRTACDFSVSRVGLYGEDVPLATDSVDSAVVTYSLCTIADPLQALHEMKRVVRPGGVIFFCEHGRAPDFRVQIWQARLDMVWHKIAGGCHSGRDIPALFAQAGLVISDLKQSYIPGPKVLSYNYWGYCRL